jgi:hypothetical protein
MAGGIGKPECHAPLDQDGPVVGQIRRMAALGPLTAVLCPVQAESMEQHVLKPMVAHAGKTFAGHVERPVPGDRRAFAQSVTIGQQEREAGRMIGAEYPDVAIEIIKAS